MIRGILMVGALVLAGCTSDSGLDGTYSGAVSASGTCVPSTITAVFKAGTLESVDAGMASWNAANPPADCSSDVMGGSGTITCGGTSGEVLCQNGGTITTLRATLVLGDGATLGGSFTIHEEIMSPPGCATDVTCDGAGTVTLTRQ